MKQESDRSALLEWPAMLAINIVRQKKSFDLVGLVVAIKKVAQASRQEGYELRDFNVGDRAESPGYTEYIRQAMHAAGIDLRRRLEKKRLQVASQLLQLIVDPHEGIGVP